MKRLMGRVLRATIGMMTVLTAAAGRTQSYDLIQPKVVLVSPKEGAKLPGGTTKFVWQLQPVENGNPLVRFELTVSAKRNGFSISKTVLSTDTAKVMDYVWTEMKKEIPRHGRYFWFVEALDKNGARFRSDVQSFILSVSPVEERIAMQSHPFTVQFAYNHHVETAEYRSLVTHADPRTHLLSYSEAGFSFKQSNVVWPRFQMQETFKLFSHGGFGIETTPKWQMHENDYFSLLPYGTVAVGWYATGLKSYSSRMVRCSIGCEMMVLPRGYLSFFSEWVPIGQIRYLEKENGLRTFDGKGWEAGVRMLVPRTILNSFKLFGLEIDLEKIPIEFRFSRIHDAYTGLDLDVRRIGIGYFVQ